MRTSELTGKALDWAVVKANQPEAANSKLTSAVTLWGFNPSEKWAQGGPIIEREGISVMLKQSNPLMVWIATYNNPWVSGPTALVAAMRCYVTSKLGDDVDIPQELL
jgi:hypothetical protein